MSEEINKAMEYAHKNIEKLMHEAVDFYLENRDRGKQKFSIGERDAILDVVGYPYKGFDDKHFTVKTLIVLDKEKTILKEKKPWVGWEVSTGYILAETGDSCERSGRSGQRVSSSETIGERELMNYFETGGKTLYRIEL
jgi:hypothetical protein